ncbi:uncharacterized protein LOC108679915 [Hyalella azteca]|uniref:Uncharacterized protein LOC108679915 n=1 Tax=Hyalella azteca TaxID=294128 RepID=A0A8B7PFQ9_HYAAZ|nr:uncharacterized protein LOC108679915 [Hyalella azteca]
MLKDQSEAGNLIPNDSNPANSQARTAILDAAGRIQDAGDSQKDKSFEGTIANDVPEVGRVKRTIRYAKRKTMNAIRVASHTTAVIAGGLAGFYLLGHPGAVAGGIGAGVVIDSAITAVDSGIQGTFQPYGLLEFFTDTKKPGKWRAAGRGVVIDGITGRFAGSAMRVVLLGRHIYQLWVKAFHWLYRFSPFYVIRIIVDRVFLVKE